MKKLSTVYVEAINKMSKDNKIIASVLTGVLALAGGLFYFLQFSMPTEFSDEALTNVPIFQGNIFWGYFALYIALASTLVFLALLVSMKVKLYSGHGSGMSGMVQMMTMITAISVIMYFILSAEFFLALPVAAFLFGALFTLLELLNEKELTEDVISALEKEQIEVAVKIIKNLNPVQYVGFEERIGKIKAKAEIHEASVRVRVKGFKAWKDIK